ncbi:anti-sigma factor family protein [bacterium]
MKCRLCKQYISQYIDNELSDKKIKVMFEHIENCTECKEELDIMKNITKSHVRMPKIKSDEYFETRLAEKIQKQSTKINVFWHFKLSYAVFMVFVLATAFFVRSNITQPEKVSLFLYDESIDNGFNNELMDIYYS